MGWKQWPSWLKGGVIGLVIGIIGNLSLRFAFSNENSFGIFLFFLGLPVFLIEAFWMNVPLNTWHNIKMKIGCSTSCDWFNCSTSCDTQLGDVLLQVIPAMVDLFYLFAIGALIGIFVERLRSVEGRRKLRVGMGHFFGGGFLSMVVYFIFFTLGMGRFRFGGLFIAFLLGALIGWIVGKIKAKKQNA